MRYTPRLWVHVICFQVHLACVDSGNFQTRRATIATQVLPVQIRLRKLFMWKSSPREKPDGQNLRQLAMNSELFFANSGQIPRSGAPAPGCF